MNLLGMTSYFGANDENLIICFQWYGRAMGKLQRAFFLAQGKVRESWLMYPNGFSFDSTRLQGR